MLDYKIAKTHEARPGFAGPGAKVKAGAGLGAVAGPALQVQSFSVPDCCQCTEPLMGW